MYFNAHRETNLKVRQALVETAEMGEDSEQLSAFDGSSHYIFLADRTNGRAYATVLRLSVVCLSVCRRLWRYVLWLNGAS